MNGPTSPPVDVILVSPDDTGARRRRRLGWIMGIVLVILGWAADSDLLQLLGFLAALGLMAGRSRRTGVRRTPQQAADHLAITYGVTAARRPVNSGRIIDV